MKFSDVNEPAVDINASAIRPSVLAPPIWDLHLGIPMSTRHDYTSATGYNTAFRLIAWSRLLTA